MTIVPNSYLEYLNHQVKEIYAREGTVILSSPEAWDKYKWTRHYFQKKPKEGYFIWVRKQTSLPILIHINALRPHLRQDLTNLVVIEKNIRAQTEAICQALANQLEITHKSQGIVVLRKNASLKYHNTHRWGNHDDVQPSYEYFLEENSYLDYIYINNDSPQQLDIKTLVHVQKKAKANILVSLRARHVRVNIDDRAILSGDNASAIMNLRIAAEDKSSITAYNQIVIDPQANEAQGHLDCQGILVDKGSSMSLIPELKNSNRTALITHEASIGRIAQEELNYLRSRGLTEKEAINLIVEGFLK